MHPYRQFILRFTFLSDQEWMEVEDNLTRSTYRAGDILLAPGKICRKLYFLESGFLRFHSLIDGKDITKYFTKPPYCFTSQRSFTSGVPSKNGIEVLQHSVIWELNKSDAFDLLKFPRWSEFIRKLIQEVQYNTEKILEEIQHQTAEERYLKMIDEDDPVLTNAPLKHIASFLGIAPQSLSRIRKKYWMEKTQNLT